MSRPILSPAAIADIDGIWDYTAENWSIEQADRYVSDIRQTCDSISSGGRRGRPIFDVRHGYHKISVGSHFIVYRLVDGGADVVRILHQMMNLPSHLKD